MYLYMEPNSKIHSFLDRVQAKWNRVLLIQVAYSGATVLAGCALATGLYFYFQTPVLSYGSSGLIIMLLGWCAVEFILWLFSFVEISLFK